jgi:hypothetical protein
MTRKRYQNRQSPHTLRLKRLQRTATVSLLFLVYLCGITTYIAMKQATTNQPIVNEEPVESGARLSIINIPDYPLIKSNMKEVSNDNN